MKELGERFIAAYYEDAKGLNIRPASAHPKATEHIGEILHDHHLIKKGHAYLSPNGTFITTPPALKATAGFPGRSGRPGRGSRWIEINEEKKNPMDSVLWKAKKEGELSGPALWRRLAGLAHIECSAMSRKYPSGTVSTSTAAGRRNFPTMTTKSPRAKPRLHGQKICPVLDAQRLSEHRQQKDEQVPHNFFTVRTFQRNSTCWPCGCSCFPPSTGTPSTFPPS